MIVRSRLAQTQGMVRVLTLVSGTKSAVFCGLVAAATVAACGGKALDVGEDQAGAGGPGAAGSSAVGTNSGGTTGSVPPHGTGAVINEVRLPAEDLANIQWPADVACTPPTPASPLVGTWKGHWPDQRGLDMEAVLTIVGLTPDGVPCGTFKIGEGPALPPVTDINAIYPPSLGAGGGVGFGSVGNAIMDPWPGYPYQMLKVQSTATRLAFKLSWNEILRPWCQPQPAYANSFSCLPEWNSGSGGPEGCSISGDTLPPTQVECFKMQYCTSTTCFCYDGRCDAALQVTNIELRWDGTALEGSVNDTQLLFLDRVTP